MTNKITYCGFAAIIGRPNVGKSTLLNDLLGFKLSITSAKPQTTRHRLLGIATEDPYQWIFVDTPGLHQSAQRALNRYLNRAALRTLHDVDVIVLVIDCTRWTTDDEWVLSHLKKIKIPVILAVNKIDKLQQRSDLLPLLKTFEEKYPFKTVVPISARLGEQVMLLKEQIKKYLPESPYLFEEDQVSDRSLPFIVAEMIREKLMRHLEKELPYSLTVTIEAFIEEPDLVRVSAVIWVEKESHKPIVIGKGGDQLRKIGKLARRDIEQYFQKQAYVQLWVKVKPGWTDDEKMLRQLGYDDER
ncbi:MAG: GTPase Era [Coxiella sp. RIFCSPHIGHO2_12_FULL_42_15]|nr:MAG: GTPase Era [Coxiella sp. RIFCSPHIGHO2_12_FULL_42_15]